MKQRAHFLLVMMLAVLFGGPAWGATYFVNNNGGSDSYTGLAPAATGGTTGPWQTMARLASATLAPGDTVYLACGGVWNETLRVPSSGATNVPITIGAGPGNCGTTPPLIDGAVTIPAHQWVQHSGSIYKARLPIDLIANPTPSTNLAPWTQWSVTGDASMSVDNACPGQLQPCLALTSGGSNSIASTNNFVLTGGVDYTAAIQLRAAPGARAKVIVRRAGPTYERLAPEQWITGTGDWQNVAIAFRAGISLSNARLDIEVPTLRSRVNMREAHVLRAFFAGTDTVATFVDGMQVRRAHHPNFGQSGNPDSPYATIANAGGKTVLDTSGINLPVGASLGVGLGVAMRTVDWAIEERAVTAVTGSRLTLSAPTGYDTLPGYGYYLTGALWMLDSPGEWFFDAPTGTLYVWMPDSAAPGNRVSTSTLPIGADLAMRSNVALAGLAVAHSGTGVALLGGTNISLSGVAITDSANYGIGADNCAQCQVVASTVARSGVDAVLARGPNVNALTVTDSTIIDAGASTRTDGWRMLPRSSAGALYSYGPSSLFARNTIIGAAKLGMYLGPSATAADNYVSQTCLVLNDCGAIYAGQVGSNSTISRNIVESVRGSVAGVPATMQIRSVGIYLDDLNAGSTVSGNTVTGAEYGLQLHNARGASVAGNLLFGNRRHQVWAHENTQATRPNGDVYGNIVTANMMIPTASGPAVNMFSEVGDTADFATFSGNHYSALLSQRVIGETSPTTGSSYTVAEWQATGREANSRVTQPVGYASFLAVGGNLIPNSNFANGYYGWTWWNQIAPLATVAIKTCSLGPCMELRSGASSSLVGSPNFSVTAGQWYRVSFDAMTGLPSQPINVVVRRGGGGSAGYEYLMPAVESYLGSTAWRRYTFTFQANKTVVTGDPVTNEFGARIDFERNQPWTTLSIAHLEMVTLAPAQAALQIKMLLNSGRAATTMNCAILTVPNAACSSFVNFGDGSPVVWPVTMAGFSASPIYTRDVTLTDTDGDGIADQQDYCPNTLAGSAVNARGCALGQ